MGLSSTGTSWSEIDACGALGSIASASRVVGRDDHDGAALAGSEIPLPVFEAGEEHGDERKGEGLPPRRPMTIHAS
jgi:hypothetical protein